MGTVAALHTLGLVDALLQTVDASGLSRRVLAAGSGVAAGTLTGWARHDSWPSLLPMLKVADQVGLRLAWQHDDLEETGLGPDGSWQMVIEGLEAAEIAWREWWPGGVPQNAIESAVMLLGAEIAWRRVHALRMEVAPSAYSAAMDPKTWRAVERGVHGPPGRRSSPGLDKLASAARFVTVAMSEMKDPPALPAEGCEVPLGWRSLDALLPLAPWQGIREPERDNLALRHRRPGRVRTDG